MDKNHIEMLGAESECMVRALREYHADTTEPEPLREIALRLSEELLWLSKAVVDAKSLRDISERWGLKCISA